jgi:predicted ATP-binding protein involved in virulence
MTNKKIFKKKFQKFYQMTPSSEPRPMREVHALELMRYYEIKKKERKSKTQSRTHDQPKSI